MVSNPIPHGEERDKVARPEPSGKITPASNRWRGASVFYPVVASSFETPLSASYGKSLPTSTPAAMPVGNFRLGMARFGIARLGTAREGGAGAQQRQPRNG